MGQFSTVFQPPKTWQDFEELTRGVASVVYRDEPILRHGRGGQLQDGVDLFFQDPRNHQWVGIQCKQMDQLDEAGNPRPGGKIKKDFLIRQVRDAERFAPALSHFVLATTAKSDVSLQQYARELSDQLVTKGKFRVSVWYWDFFEAMLNARYELLQNYYHNVIGIRNATDQDRIILDAIREAFRRPAFQTSLGSEHVDDFLQALKDTTKMLNLGVLVDRESGAIIHRTIGGIDAVVDPGIKSELSTARTALRSLRADFEEGLACGQIGKRNGYTEFHNATLERKLERDRQLILGALNAALQGQGLPILP